VSEVEISNFFITRVGTPLRYGGLYKTLIAFTTAIGVRTRPRSLDPRPQA
jgi:hypothetical protein